MANDAIMKFGSATTVISHAAALGDGANTYSAITNMTELDNSTTLYPLAIAVLDIADTFAAAPDDGGTLDLYMMINEVDGASSDELPAPAATDIKRAHYVGSFSVTDLDVAVRQQITISLVGVQKADFFLVNNCGQSTSYTSNAMTVKVTPFTYTPSA